MPRGKYRHSWREWASSHLMVLGLSFHIFSQVFIYFFTASTISVISFCDLIGLTGFDPASRLARPTFVLKQK